MQNADQIRLQHMLEAAQEAVSLTQGKTRNDLNDDRVLALALVKLIEIIGEAATRISKEGHAQIAEIPWPSIISMRNRLIHAYFDIDLDRVWDTVTDDLPPLIEALRNTLPSEPE
jgi:uncharacterized protein with HEPN domain